jgi:RNA recognition motif-containing protein
MLHNPFHQILTPLPPKGIAFCEYADRAATEIAVEGLNGMEIVDKSLKVQRASIGVQQASGLEMGVGAMSMLAATKSDETEDGRVLQLLNMVTAEELMDNEDYEGIYIRPPSLSCLSPFLHPSTHSPLLFPFSPSP